MQEKLLTLAINTHLKTRTHLPMTSKIKYIFCVNTGRSGSNYLYTLFKHANDAISMHEMKPIGHSEEMRQFFKDNITPMQELTKKRLKKIRELSTNNETFIETSHMFIKGFGWFLAEEIPNHEIGVIILTREKAKIVSSFNRMNSVALSQRGRNWIITPDIKSPLVPPPSLLGFHQTSYFIMKFLKKCETRAQNLIKRIFPNINFLESRFFKHYNLKCLEWYVEETKALGEKFQLKHPNIRYYNVDVKDLNDIEKVKSMFHHFGLTYQEEITQHIGKPTNLKEKYKKI